MILKSFSPLLTNCQLMATHYSGFCTNYSNLHNKAFYLTIFFRCNSYFIKCSLPRYKPWLIRVVIQKVSSTCLPSNDRAPTQSCGTPTICGGGRLDPLPPGKQQTFNRMNGSPGDPPGNLMDRIFNQRIVPFIHRLAGDPSGKEAGWETNIRRYQTCQSTYQPIRLPYGPVRT